MAATTVVDREDNGHDGLAVESKSAASLLTIPVVTHRALVERGNIINKLIGQGMCESILVARSKRHHCEMAIKAAKKLSDGLIELKRQWAIDNERKFADLFDHPYLNVHHEIIDPSRR